MVQHIACMVMMRRVTGSGGYLVWHGGLKTFACEVAPHLCQSVPLSGLMDMTYR